ncbi:VanZ family protein [Alkalihalobacterium bogoriense]|uniref:VanZ family protein n=1 Tax=Alkalihalobacterium bogoriense TaxID=246272 RepID=UPI000B23114B|nr:VanZ family protein [Alkalihalobacterium bogoriense]
MFFIKPLKQTEKSIQKIGKILFFIYLLAVIYVTLFAWNYGASLGPEGPGGRNYNLTPFRSIYRISVFSKDIMDPIRILIGNIILFIPFGFLLPLAFTFFRTSIMKVTLLAMFTSITIEICQFLFTHRVANIDDVILNTFGAWIGAVVVFVLLFIQRRVIVLFTRKK